MQTRALLYMAGQRSVLLRELEREGRAPSRRTFYSWIQDLGSAALGTPWTVVEDKTGAPDVVLRVRRALHEASSGRVSNISVDEAAFIVAVVRAKPEMLERTEPFAPVGLAPWFWAQRYRRAQPSEYAAIDLELANA